MSSPEMQRQVRQQRTDIDSVYELLDEVRGTVADLDAKVDAGFAAVNAKIHAGPAACHHRGGSSVPHRPRRCALCGDSGTAGTAGLPAAERSAAHTLRDPAGRGAATVAPRRLLESVSVAAGGSCTLDRFFVGVVEFAGVARFGEGL